MTEKILYTALLFLNGIMWIVLTILFKNIIKKRWLYTLFPLLINSTCSLVVIVLQGRQILLIPLFSTIAYYLFSTVRGMRIVDVLTIPVVINIIIVLALI